MAYRFKKNEAVEVGVGRIVTQEIDAVLAAIQDPAVSVDEAIHQARQRCKKIRAVLKLIRPALGQTYALENQWYRDAARGLAPQRDAVSRIAAYDLLMERVNEQVKRGEFASIRRQLTRRKKAIDADADGAVFVERFAAALREGRGRVESWSLNNPEGGVCGFAIVEGGLHATYRKGLAAMQAAYDDPSPTRFHEWRKRVKDHRYHVQLLRGVWKPVMKTWCDLLHDLSDLLGADQDLAVLRQYVTAERESLGDQRKVEALLALIQSSRGDLETRARTLGRRAFAEQPKEMVKRVEAYWREWREED
ncbi:MAG: CHAD domain-containing protein [Phycisphaeraceae bacterium]